MSSDVTIRVDLGIPTKRKVREDLVNSADHPMSIKMSQMLRN